jgi:4'-phosphopantetheinyl transferase
MATLSDVWKSEPIDYAIDYGAVHVWRCELQSSHLSNMGFVGSLSTEEIEKAQRFVRESDRDRYIFAHALLRSILGTYLGCRPQKLVFGTNQYGKPFLVSPNGDNKIQFNLSHSHNMALIAVARQIAVGIDVEYIRRVSDAHEIVDRFFSTHERHFLFSLSPMDFKDAFFACWTLKESFAKGLGRGLSYPLDKLSVTFSNGRPGNIVFCDSASDFHSWKMFRLSPGPGYSGAVAIEAPGSEPVLFEYHEH